MISPIGIVGIDWSADPKKVGLAWSVLADDHAELRSVQKGSPDNVATITGWLEGEGPHLLGIDAPLGWPVCLAQSIIGHTAGARLPADPDRLFHRHTDDEVRRSTRKKPLEVGADRIARTALSPLQMLDKLRGATGASIPLSWDPTAIEGVQAIEVYPAATMAARHWTVGKYKNRNDIEWRKRIIRQLSGELDLRSFEGQLEDSADALDAVVCVLAGLDYLHGLADLPDNVQLAHREGCIWVRRPSASDHQPAVEVPTVVGPG